MMPIPRVFLVVMALVPAGIYGAEPEVLSDVRDTLIVRRSVVMAEGEFSVGRAEEICRSFLESDHGQHKLLILGVFADDGDARRTGSGKGATDVNYAGWRQLYEMYGRRPQPMAEMIAIGGDAVMRWRNVLGGVGRTVLRGSDPLRIRVGEARAEVLHIAAYRRPQAFRDPPGETMWVDVFLRANDLRLDVATELTNRIAAQMGLASFVTHFRTDAWFIVASSFPIVYRFDRSLVPPGEKEYRESAWVLCWVKSGDVSCENIPPY